MYFGMVFTPVNPPDSEPYVETIAELLRLIPRHVYIVLGIKKVKPSAYQGLTS